MCKVKSTLSATVAEVKGHTTAMTNTNYLSFYVFGLDLPKFIENIHYFS